LEDSGVDGRKILKWSFKKWDRGMDWIDVTKDTGTGGRLL
jgi:hypothetical protein